MNTKEICDRIIRDCESLAKDLLTTEVSRNRVIGVIQAHSKNCDENTLDDNDICRAITDLYWECYKLIELQPQLKSKYRDVSHNLSEAKAHVIQLLGEKEWFCSNRSLDRSKPIGWIDL